MVAFFSFFFILRNTEILIELSFWLEIYVSHILNYMIVK